MKVADSTSGEEPWWIEDDEAQRCDDNPDLHYGLCEFDTYDGICWHCKNMVHPDIHLIHLICDRRRADVLLEWFHNIEGEDLDPELLEELDRILSPLEERDITSHPNLPPEDRVKALQEMDDRDYILSQLEARFPDWKERNLSQVDLDPGGVGLGYSITRLYDDIHSFNQKEWGPGWAAEWGLQKPQDLSNINQTPVEDPSYVSRAIGVFLLAAYGWYVLEEHLLEVFEGTSGAGAEFLIWLFLIPVFVIHKIFFNTPKLEQIITTEGKKITEEVYEQRLKIASGVLIFALIMPWWGFSSGFQALRWSPQDAWFVLTEARLWGLPLLGYIHWQMSTLLPLVFVATFVATWSKTSPRQEFGRKASNFHLLFFAVWYLIGIYQWGNFLPQEWNYAVFIAAASGIGLHPTAYGLAEKFSSRTSE